jgi:hypothetical protein
MLLSLLAALAISGSGFTGASTPVLQAVAPTAPAKVKTKTAESDTICWTEEPVGSHIPHRYCAPRAYWEARQRADQNAINRFYHTTIGGGSVGGISATGGGGSGGGPSGR